MKEHLAALRAAPQNIRASYKTLRKPPAYELYDLKQDPHEFDNLSESPEHLNTLSELKRELHAWRIQTKDPFLKQENVLRLQKEIAATLKDGEYHKPETWDYLQYLAPANN